MGGRGASDDLRGVVVARDQSVVIDVEILHPIVGVDFGWERDEKSATWNGNLHSAGDNNCRDAAKVDKTRLATLTKLRRVSEAC
jgi:hypothetical protein